MLGDDPFSAFFGMRWFNTLPLILMVFGLSFCSPSMSR